MARDEDDFDDDERITRATRRTASPTDRLPREVPRGEPVRSDWLSSRTAGRTSRRRTAGVPSSRQEFALWLQYGGWRTIALVAAGTFAAIMLMIVIGNRANSTAIDQPEPTADIGVGGAGSAAVFATTDSLLQPSVTPAASPPPVAATGAQFRVFGTDGLGLFLRSDHVSDPANVVETLPDGTVVTIAGEDYVGPDRVWKNIRSPAGNEGWVASDFLEQVQP